MKSSSFSSGIPLKGCRLAQAVSGQWAALCSVYPLPGFSPRAPASLTFAVTSPAGAAQALSSLPIICCFWWALDALGSPGGGWRAGKQLSIHPLWGQLQAGFSWVRMPLTALFWKKGQREKMNWDIAVVSMCFSLSSLSFQQGQDARYTTRAEMWEMWEIILMRERRTRAKSILWKKWNLSELSYLFLASFFVWSFG